MELFASRYEIVKPLGEGGMARVDLAIDRARGELVALKRLFAHRSVEEIDLQFFRQEFAILAEGRLPGVPKGLDSGTADGVPYFTMEFVDGESFESRLARQGADWIELARLVGRASAALDAIHRSGVVHRDVKPSNVLVDRKGRIWWIDFGISSFSHSAGLPEEDRFIIGTLAYLAPERVGYGFDERDPRSDIYSLGVMLYRVLTGRLPFESEKTCAVLKAIEFDIPRPPHVVRPEIPLALSRVVMRALTKSPRDRFATAGEFAEAIDRALADTAQTSAAA